MVDFHWKNEANRWRSEICLIRSYADSLLKILPEERVNWLEEVCSADAYITWNLSFFFKIQDIFGKREAFHFKIELVWVDLLPDDAA